MPKKLDVFDSMQPVLANFDFKKRIIHHDEAVRRARYV